MYQFDDSATTISIPCSGILPLTVDRLVDALVVAGIAIFWGLLLYAALSFAPL